LKVSFLRAERDNLLSKLDARIRLFLLVLLSSIIFFVNDMVRASLFLILLLVVILLSGLSLSRLLVGFRQVLMLIFITTVINSFMMEGKVIWQWGVLKLTVEGLRFSCLVSIRLVFVSLFSIVIIANMDQGELAIALRQVMAPFKLFGFPVDELALALTISLRFLPVLLGEIERLYMSQLAKGIELKRLRLSKQLEFWISVIVPLLKNTLRRAEDLAIALEMRGYYEKNKRELVSLRYSWIDLLALLIVGLFLFWVFR